MWIESYWLLYTRHTQYSNDTQTHGYYDEMEKKHRTNNRNWNNKNNNNNKDWRIDKQNVWNWTTQLFLWMNDERELEHMRTNIWKKKRKRTRTYIVSVWMRLAMLPS